MPEHPSFPLHMKELLVEFVVRVPWGPCEWARLGLRDWSCVVKGGELAGAGRAVTNRQGSTARHKAGLLVLLVAADDRPGDGGEGGGAVPG